MGGDAQMSAYDVDEERIALGRPDRRDMADRPDRDADEPEAQAETDGAGERAVHDGDGAWGAAEQDRLGQRPMDRDREARHFASLIHDAHHQTSAPPPKLKKLRKNELAANAIDRPNTIWIIRRAPPERLGQLLLEEHPQVAAAIVSQLNTEQAAKVLMSMEEERRVEIVGRLATIERVPRDLVEDASKALADALAESGAVEEDDDGDGVDGKKLAAEILKGLSQEDAEAVLDGLADKYSEVADSLRDAMFAFEDLAEISTAGLQALMREVTSDQLLPALKTASPKLVDKLMSVISSRAAETLREDLSLLRPMRLSEVEEAQKAVLEVAMRLAEEGRIQLPRGGGEELV